MKIQSSVLVSLFLVLAGCTPELVSTNEPSPTWVIATSTLSHPTPQPGTPVETAFPTPTEWVMPTLPPLVYHPESLPVLPENALLIANEGKLWLWDGTHVQDMSIDEFYIQTPSASPDGRYLAYVYRMGDRGPASQIWLWDITTGEVLMLATPPLDRDYFDSEYYGFTDPVWSPDSTQLAWGALHLSYVMNPAEEEFFDLIVYDLAAATSRKVGPLQLGYQDGNLHIDFIEWRNSGISRSNTVGPTGVTNICIVQLNGQQNCAEFPYEYSFYHHLEEGFFAIHTWETQYEWHTFDFTTGAIDLMEGLPAVYSTTAKSSIALAIEPYPGGIEEPGTWWIIGPDGSALYRFDIDLSVLGSVAYMEPQVAISQSGDALAFVTDALYIWQNGNLMRIDEIERDLNRPYYDIGRVVWGPTSWRIVPPQNTP